MIFLSFKGNADFADGSQNYISLTPTITSSSVNLTFTNGAPSSTTATLYTGSNSSNVNLSKTVSGNAVAFSTSDFTSNTLDYGVYEIMLQFNDGGGSYSLKTAVVYELPISGFHVGFSTSNLSVGFIWNETLFRSKHVPVLTRTFRNYVFLIFMSFTCTC